MQQESCCTVLNCTLNSAQGCVSSVCEEDRGVKAVCRCCGSSAVCKRGIGRLCVDHDVQHQV